MKVLLVQTGFLGDVILSTPVIPYLKGHYPGCSLSVLTTPAAADLVRYHPDVDEVLTFDKRKRQRGLRGLLEMAGILRSRHFDVAVSLHKSWRSALLLRLARIRERYGFKEAHGRFLYTRTASRRRYSHDVQRNLAVLETLGYRVDEMRPELHVGVPETAREKAATLLQELPCSTVIGLAPGSVWRTKRWTERGFADVGRALLDEGCGIVIIGGPSDTGVADKVVELIGADPCLRNLCGQLSLVESKAVIERLSLLVTNDSAPLHLASAAKTPLVAIFCATVPEMGFGPFDVPHEVCGVEGLRCRPCGRHGGDECPEGTHACRYGLSSADVVTAVRRLLAGRGNIVKLPSGRR